MSLNKIKTVFNLFLMPFYRSEKILIIKHDNLKEMNFICFSFKYVFVFDQLSSLIIGR